MGAAQDEVGWSVALCRPYFDLAMVGTPEALYSIGTRLAAAFGAEDRKQGAVALHVGTGRPNSSSCLSWASFTRVYWPARILPSVAALGLSGCGNQFVRKRTKRKKNSKSHNLLILEVLHVVMYYRVH